MYYFIGGKRRYLYLFINRISLYMKMVLYFAPCFRQGMAGHRTGGNAWQFDKKPLVVVYYNVDYVKDPKG